MKEKINNNNNCIPGSAGGVGSNKKQFQQSASTLRGARKEDPQHKVVGKTVGGEDSKYRCVVKVGFRKTSLY